MPREIDTSQITEAVRQLAATVSITLGERELSAMKRALEAETFEPAQAVLRDLIENASIAAAEGLPICQDTGLAVVFIDIGQEVLLTGPPLAEAVDSGVRAGYEEASLRDSVVADPLDRVNTGDNTPAILHVASVPGDKLRVILDAKGGGSENCSRLAMLTPAEGREGVADFVVETVKRAGGKSCPPMVVGVGLGGNFETAPLLAKRALLRDLGKPNLNAEAADLERRLLDRINATGIGPAGLGGLTTALAVHVEIAPCHIASLPAAVNLDCHAHRHGEVTL